MVDADAHVVSVVDLCVLLRQWPLSVVSGMSRKQTDYESLRHVSVNSGFEENKPGVVHIVER